jgi:hypothetical protein
MDRRRPEKAETDPLIAHVIGKIDPEVLEVQDRAPSESRATRIEPIRTGGRLLLLTALLTFNRTTASANCLLGDDQDALPLVKLT